MLINSFLCVVSWKITFPFDGKRVCFLLQNVSIYDSTRFDISLDLCLSRSNIRFITAGYSCTYGRNCTHNAKKYVPSAVSAIFYLDSAVLITFLHHLPKKIWSCVKVRRLFNYVENVMVYSFRRIRPNESSEERRGAMFLVIERITYV